MKKLILVTLMSLLGTSVFGAVCSNNYVEELMKNDRYFISHVMNADNSIFVIDKTSIKKVGNNLEAWVIGEYRGHSSLAYIKIKWKFNVKDNSAQVMSAVGLNCNRYIIYSENIGKPSPIVPDSANETLLKNLLEYLKVNR